MARRGRFVMTAKRKAALRKAQLASARKRRRGRVTPSRARRNRKISKYGSRRSGVNQTQAQARHVRRQKRQAKAVAVVSSGVYIAGVSYLLAPQGTTNAARRVMKAPSDYARVKHNAKVKYGNMKTRRQFNKIINSNYSGNSIPGGKQK